MEIIVLYFCSQLSKHAFIDDRIRMSDCVCVANALAVPYVIACHGVCSLIHIADDHNVCLSNFSPLHFPVLTSICSSFAHMVLNVRTYLSNIRAYGVWRMAYTLTSQMQALHRSFQSGMLSSPFHLDAAAAAVAAVIT